MNNQLLGSASGAESAQSLTGQQELPSGWLSLENAQYQLAPGSGGSDSARSPHGAGTCGGCGGGDHSVRDHWLLLFLKQDWVVPLRRRIVRDHWVQSVNSVSHNGWESEPLGFRLKSVQIKMMNLNSGRWCIYTDDY